MHAPFTPKRTRGFTLIELLVVISIIAILISILLPEREAGPENAEDFGCIYCQRTLEHPRAGQASQHGHAEQVRDERHVSSWRSDWRELTEEQRAQRRAERMARGVQNP